MAYYDHPTLAQRTKLMEIIHDPVICALIDWGTEKLERGATMHLTGMHWCKGFFSTLIDAALANRESAEQIIYSTLGKDFITSHLNK